jgi:beta-N-acetylhexosaminidase
LPNASILAPKGQRLTNWEKAFFRENNPFGFIVFARNIDTSDQILGLTFDLRNAVGRDAPILIDQEGGRVNRLKSFLNSDTFTGEFFGKLYLKDKKLWAY